MATYCVSVPMLSWHEWHRCVKTKWEKVAWMVVAIGIGLRLVGNSPITLQLRVLWCPVVGGLDALQMVVAGAVGAWPAGA